MLVIPLDKDLNVTAERIGYNEKDEKVEVLEKIGEKKASKNQPIMILCTMPEGIADLRLTIKSGLKKITWDSLYNGKDGPGLTYYTTKGHRFVSWRIHDNSAQEPGGYDMGQKKRFFVW